MPQNQAFSPGPWEVSPPTLIERLIRLGLPLLPMDEANDEIVRLTIKNLTLQAQLDAVKMGGEAP